MEIRVATTAAAVRTLDNHQQYHLITMTTLGDYGEIFMGNPKNLERAGYKDKGGNIAYDPEFECTGGSSDPNDRQCPYETKESDAMGLETTGWDGRLMHLNMPSFRDPLCPRTLKYLFTKAKRPNDIRVRVLQQNMDVDDDCLETYCKMMAQLREETGGGDTSKGGPAGEDCPHRDQIFVHPISAKDAAGPTYARGLIGQDMHAAYAKNEISPQDFCMSTDSHMDFEPEWDEKMVNMWDQAKNEYAVLSTYVANIDQLGQNLNGVHEVPHLCMITFTSQVRTTATKCARNLVKPKLTNAVWVSKFACSIGWSSYSSLMHGTRTHHTCFLNPKHISTGSWIELQQMSCRVKGAGRSTYTWYF